MFLLKNCIQSNTKCTIYKLYTIILYVYKTAVQISVLKNKVYRRNSNELHNLAYNDSYHDLNNLLLQLITCYYRALTLITRSA